MAATTAELRARDLLRSVAGDEAGDMYEDLGFVGVIDRRGEFGYLLYPQRPIVSFDYRSGEPLSELCVRFEDTEELPDADDVLAKWMSLAAEPESFLEIAELDRLGRQHDPAMLRRDVAVLDAWNRRRAEEAALV